MFKGLKQIIVQPFFCLYSACYMKKVFLLFAGEQGLYFSRCQYRAV